MKVKPMISAVLTVSIFAFTQSACADAPYYHGGYYHGGHYHEHDNHSSVGVVIGVPFGVPGYYGYGYPYGYSPYFPYYPPYPVYPPAVVAVPSTPPTYVQRDTGQPSVADTAPATSSWYYCSESKAYYPYVKQCPGGWQPVAPQPEDQ
jgi:hypothetical protein